MLSSYFLSQKLLRLPLLAFVVELMYSTVSPFTAVLSIAALQGKSQLRVAEIAAIKSQLRVAEIFNRSQLRVVILKITEAVQVLYT